MPKTLHHPPHIFLDETWYFISAATYNKSPIFNSPTNKLILKNQMVNFSKEFGFPIVAWVILDNHYHTLLKINEGELLKSFIQKLHGRTSYEINKSENKRGRRIWHNYWDTCIESESNYWMRFNYTHHNPVKHSYVNERGDWDYSSYQYYLKKYGEEWMADVLMQYPVIDFTDSGHREQPIYPSASLPLQHGGG